MKSLLAFLLLVATSAFAQTAASVDNLEAIQIINAQGIWAPPQPLGDLWQNATLRTPLRNMLKAKVAWFTNPLDAKDFYAAAQARGATLVQADIDALNARLDTFRQQKETALMTVKATDPQRALTKMQALIARGLPITQTTQDAVNAAAGVSSTPTPTATPTPTPEPNDGL